MNVEDLPRAILRHVGLDDAEGELWPRHGWSNQAWIGDSAVVRISSGRLRESLSHEAAVTQLLCAAGLPVAEPLAVGAVSAVTDTANADAEWIVNRRLPGVTLASGWPSLDSNARRRAGRDIGEFLRTLHDVAVAVDLTPPWWVDAHHPDAFHNAYHPQPYLAVEMAAAAHDLAFADDELVERLEMLVVASQQLFAEDRLVFTHTDVHGHNLLVDPASGALTGVLDWEGAHPAAPDIELDMLLRWASAADKFAESPNSHSAIGRDDALELVGHIAAAYPEPFQVPHLVERLRFYEVQWQLVQLFFDRYWLELGHGGGSAPCGAWDELRLLMAGEWHVNRFDLGRRTA